MEKLIEALHVIKDVCMNNGHTCANCPLCSADGLICLVQHTDPEDWKINNKRYRALLLKE